MLMGYTKRYSFALAMGVYLIIKLRQAILFKGRLHFDADDVACILPSRSITDCSISLDIWLSRSDTRAPIVDEHLRYHY